MFKILVLETLYALSDDAAEFQIKDRLSFMRFLRLGFHDRVPDAETIWLFREQLTRAGAISELFATFEAHLKAHGHLAMSGQIIDASIIARRDPSKHRCFEIVSGWSPMRPTAVAPLCRQTRSQSCPTA